MSRRAAFRLGLAVACLLLTGLRELRRPGPLPVVVLWPRTTLAPPSAAAAGLEPDFASRMTPDDVARGVWALSDPAVDGPGLSAEQAAAALPVAREARVARADVDRLRAAERAARSDLRETGAALARALTALGWRPEAP